MRAAFELSTKIYILNIIIFRASKGVVLLYAMIIIKKPIYVHATNVGLMVRALDSRSGISEFEFQRGHIGSTYNKMPQDNVLICIPAETKPFISPVSMNWNRLRPQATSPIACLRGDSRYTHSRMCGGGRSDGTVSCVCHECVSWSRIANCW